MTALKLCAKPLLSFRNILRCGHGTRSCECIDLTEVHYGSLTLSSREISGLFEGIEEGLTELDGQRLKLNHHSLHTDVGLHDCANVFKSAASAVESLASPLLKITCILEANAVGTETRFSARLEEVSHTHYTRRRVRSTFTDIATDLQSSSTRRSAPKRSLSTWPGRGLKSSAMGCGK